MGKKRIGFVGLGLMGTGMASNLISSGYPLIGYDIDKTKVDAVAQKGGKGIDIPKELPRQVDVIMMSLPNSHIVNGVVKDSLRLFDTGRKGLIVIDTTTADPAMSQELSTGLREKGIEMLDATISGTSKRCAEKDITMMVGGNEEVFFECKDIFACIARETVFVGKNGTGALAKLIVNLVLDLNRMALAEGLALSKKAGIDQYQILEVLKKSAAYSKAMDDRGLKMIEKDFLPPVSRMSNTLKDVQLILDLGRRLDFPLPLLSCHAQALISELAKGRGEWDSSDIICFYEELANIQ
jgi:3-hydroxyisobutyrate dehydrogenase-like beta-hydroxyacid dehydrogenase